MSSDLRSYGYTTVKPHVRRLPSKQPKPVKKRLRVNGLGMLVDNNGNMYDGAGWNGSL